MAVDNAKPAILAKTLVPRNAVNHYVTQSHTSSAKRHVRKGLGSAHIRDPHEPLISNLVRQFTSGAESTFCQYDQTSARLHWIPPSEMLE